MCLQSPFHCIRIPRGSVTASLFGALHEWDGMGWNTHPYTSIRTRRRDYLFKSVDSSESVSADAYGKHHITYPIRDLTMRTAAVVDIGIVKEQKNMPDMEKRSLVKILRARMHLLSTNCALEQRDCVITGGLVRVIN